MLVLFSSVVVTTMTSFSTAPALLTHLFQTALEIKLDERQMEKLSTIRENRPERVLSEFELW